MEATPRVPGTPAARVLLIEDDADLAEILTVALQADAISIATCASGEEALQLAHREAFDLVLLDLGLPHMDGFSVLRGLRTAPQTRLTPVIILTAQQALAEKIQGFELGATDYVTKPFEMIELRARIRAVLAQEQLKKDLTSANQALEAARVAAEESARTKADFLANMSHEIRTPMNGVIAMTGLLLQTDLAADQRDYVETIRTSGESLLTIINDILNFSKIASGKLEFENAPFALRGSIEESLDLLATRAAEKGVDLGYRCALEIPELVCGDVTRLRQILVNLVGNAVKFTASGEVFVTVEPARAGTPAPLSPTSLPLHFTVRDTGIGIPADRLDRLFQSFSQVDSSITRQYGGTGLGLAISRGLVELMGGRIWVESTLGTGTTFHFTLPLNPSVAAAPLHAKPIPALAGREVIIVEDNATVRASLADHIRQWGLVPVPFPSRAEARQRLSRADTAPTSAIFLIDLELPEADRAVVLSTDRSAPLIYMSSVGGRTDAPPGAPLVNKPVKPAQLRSALLQAATGQQQEPKSPATKSRLDTGLGNKAPLQILLTDDNIINQKVALRLLQQLGYTADVANTGLEALRAIERKPYDLILMDVQMPEMDGLEATRQIRQRQRQQSGETHSHFQRPIAIVAMTANAMQGDRDKCVAAGMDDYLPKPVRPESLQAALQKAAATLAEQQAKAAASSPPSAPATLSTAVATSSAAASPAARETVASPTPPGPASGPGPAIPVGGAGPGMSPPALPALQIVEQPPVDLGRLNDFAGGNAENFNELVALYLKQTSEQLVQLRDGLEQQSAEQVARVSHSCAGASATCGMTAMVPLLRQISSPTSPWHSPVEITLTHEKSAHH
jgi:signal transduction histidine kinase